MRFTFHDIKDFVAKIQQLLSSGSMLMWQLKRCEFLLENIYN